VVTEDRVRALDRKLLRDLSRIRVQAAAIAVLVGCAVAVFVGSAATWRALARSQARYYETNRFADVFAEVRRAPEPLAAELAAIPGVAEVETRAAGGATLALPGVAEPVTARVLSLPPGGARLNRPHLRAGRGLAPGAADEVLISEGFALARRLGPGDVLDVVVNGRSQRFTVAGVAISPDTIYAIPAGALFPDDRHFGVLWAPRDALAAALDLEGAFSEVSLRLAPGAREPQVIAAVDRLLAPYGGLGAIGRDRHVSHAFLTDEIRQLRAMAAVVPAIFLGVSAFLVSVVLARLVGTQRRQIGMLKALGYGTRDIGWHYAKLVLVVGVAGCAAGAVGGLVMAAGMARTYADFYRLPELVLGGDAPVIVLASALALAGALAGSLGAVRAAVGLSPAEAMRPPAPPTYRPTLLERAGLTRALAPAGRMVLRDLGRRPLRAALSALGIAFAVAILVVSWFSEDAIDVIFDRTLVRAQRDDATVTFTHALAEDALAELRRLPGVRRVEPFRTWPANLRSGPRTALAALSGVDAGADLSRIVDASGAPVSTPPEGLVVSRKLAQDLGVGRGGRIQAEILDGARPTRSLPVVAVVDDFLGLQATGDRRWIAETLGEAPLVSGARLAVDPAALADVQARLQGLPAVAGVTLRAATLAAYDELIASFLLTYMAVISALALAIAAGVVYNAARVTWAERERELATLRVLGFTRGEIWRILAGEMGVHVAAAIPAGWAIGLGAVLLTAHGASTDLYRLPAVVTRSTYATAALVVCAGAVAVLLVALRWVRALDLVEVLKSTE
jgi:putative ABC transport system permease protein